MYIYIYIIIFSIIISILPNRLCLSRGPVLRHHTLVHRRPTHASMFPRVRSKQRDPNPKDTSGVGKETSTYKGFHKKGNLYYRYITLHL